MANNYLSMYVGEIKEVDAGLADKLISEGLAEEYNLIEPTGEIEITENGDFNVANYATAHVDVASAPDYQTVTVNVTGDPKFAGSATNSCIECIPSDGSNMTETFVLTRGETHAPITVNAFKRHDLTYAEGFILITALTPNPSNSPTVTYTGATGIISATGITRRSDNGGTNHKSWVVWFVGNAASVTINVTWG